MTNNLNDDKEFALHAMFLTVVPPVADDGFSNKTVSLVRRNVWKRRMVFFITLSLWLIFALPLVPQLLSIVEQQLLSVSTVIESSRTTQQLRNMIEILPPRESMNSASQELSHLSQRLSGNSTVQHMLLLLIAGLMVVVGTLMRQITKN